MADSPVRFSHNEQSLRIVECLEYEGKGLNLTREVRDGILGTPAGTFPRPSRARTSASPTASPT